MSARDRRSLMRRPGESARPCFVTGLKRLVAGFACAGALLGVAGCTVTAGGFANENDRLRYELEGRSAELAAMTRDRDEWRAKAMERAAAIDALEDGAVLDALPRIVELDIDRLTGFVDRDGEAGYEGVDVYLLPKDARGRFVQAVGTLTVTLIELPTPESEGEARTIVSRTLGPVELREAYRNTLLSVHYSVPLALEPVYMKDENELAAKSGGRSVVAKQLVATFRDALTNETHTNSMIIE